MPAQTLIINAANNFLSKQANAITLNKGGICGGLASLFVCYTLEGKKAKFFHLAKKLAHLPESYQLGQDNDLDLFIRDIEIEFNRFNYTQGHYYQGDMEHTVFIDNKPIKKEFCLGLVDSAKNWAKLLEQIRNDGRACYIRSHNHAVAITFTANQYEIYDPNYDEDEDTNPAKREFNTRSFNTAAETIAELSKQFGYPDTNNVGLGIIVYAHPHDVRIAHYPDKKQIYTTSLIKKEDFQKKIAIKEDDWDFNSLFFATHINDHDAVAYHLQKDELSLKDCAYLMQMEANNTVVFARYSQETSLKNKQHLMYYAIWAGNTELFQKMAIDYQKRYVTNTEQRELFQHVLHHNFSLIRAAQSRNPSCLSQVLELYQQYGIKPSTIDSNELLSVIKQLTINGNEALLKSFTDYLGTLNEEMVAQGLRTAAKHDKRGALKFWLKAYEQIPQTLHETLIHEKLISSISLLNFTYLLQAGFTLALSVLPLTLKRRSQEFFELSIKNIPQFYWVPFITQLKRNSLANSIDLFAIHQGLNAFQILTSYQQDELIQANWPETVTQEQGSKALLFSCACGNQKTALFLTQKGFKIPLEQLVSELDEALKKNDPQQVTALLTTAIDYPHFFTQKNKLLIEQLVAAGHSDFIIRSWNTYQKNQPTTHTELSLDDLLIIALNKENKVLYSFIVKTAPQLAFSLIKMIISNPIPECYPQAIALSQALPTTLYLKFIHTETTPYEEALFFRTTKEDEFADRAFRATAKHMVQPLCNLLIYAIEHHYFSFAEQLATQVHLSPDELYQLFVQANQIKNHKTLSFLLEQYSYLTTNKEVYTKLAEAHEFDLIAQLLARNKLHNEAVSIYLLKAAVKAHHKELIAQLRPFINATYKIQGSPLYQAIAEENIEGCILLLQQGASIHEYPITEKLLFLALRQKNTILLHQILQYPEMKEHLATYYTTSLDLLFRNATPETVSYLYQYMTVSSETTEETFNHFLTFAISSNDVDLLSHLQKSEYFSHLDKHQLFQQACMEHAPAVANELLRFPLNFLDQKALHTQLDQLFQNVTNESAHFIYDLLYKNALNRLYNLLITSRYRPFAALYKSIDDLIADPGLSSFKRNHLLLQAMDDNDQHIFNRLLQQIEIIPDLSEQIIGLFTTHAHKPLIINALLERYKLNDVLAKAIALKKWPTVAALLKDRKISAIAPSLIEQIKKNDHEILRALEEDAKQHLHEDPRRALNNLLVDSPKCALAAVLINKKDALQNTIMAIEELMVQKKIALHGQFYRFDLYNKLLAENAALEQLIPRIKQFFERNRLLIAAEIIKNDKNRQELMAFKEIMESNQLAPAYFEERTELEDVFDALALFEKQQEVEQRKWEQEKAELQRLEREKTNRQVIKEPVKMVNPLAGLITVVASYARLRAKEGDTHYWPSLFQYTKRDKNYAAQQFIHALKNPACIITPYASGALNNGRLERFIKNYLKDNQSAIRAYFNHPEPINTVQSLINLLNQQDPIAKLIHLLEEYDKQRAEQDETYFFSFFPQYTRTEKRHAVAQLLAKIKGVAGDLDNISLGALRQGSLGNMLEQFLAEYQLVLQKELQVTSIATVDELITALDNNRCRMQLG